MRGEVTSWTLLVAVVLEWDVIEVCVTSWILCRRRSVLPLYETFQVTLRTHLFYCSYWQKIQTFRPMVLHYRKTVRPQLFCWFKWFTWIKFVFSYISVCTSFVKSKTLRFIIKVGFYKLLATSLYFGSVI